ncbi:tyrosine-type recombinase/integrase [Paludibaculum fermentans]|uniref:tyrosine-type recombinase/integrase n=1 Tax=Paludibaculum fermentans TaxID=1473598 RepID=UPI003EBCA73D
MKNEVFEVNKNGAFNPAVACGLPESQTLVKRPDLLQKRSRTHRTPVKQQLSKAFERFIADRQRASDKKPLRPKTVRSYRQCYEVFKPALLQTAYEEDLIEEFRTIIDQRLSLGKVNRSGMNVYIRGFNSFLSWCNEFGFLDNTLKIEKLSVEKRKPFPTLDVDDILKWQEFDAAAPSQLRAKHIGLLILDTGMRIEECLMLKESDIEWAGNRLWIGKGKGGANREVPLSAEGRKTLRYFLALTSDVRSSGKHSLAPLFTTKHGGHVSYRNVLRDLKAVAKRLGFAWVGWHSFRRTFATLYLRNGGLLSDLQQILGHTDVRTTIRYVGIKIEEIVAIHDQHSPLAQSGRRPGKRRPKDLKRVGMTSPRRFRKG